MAALSSQAERSGGVHRETDDELIRNILAGKLADFDELMRRYERLVYRVCYSFGRSPEDAFDLTQSVFLKAFRSLESFRSEANFRTWLMRIAYNEGINLVRSRSRREDRHESLEGADARLVEPPAQERGLLHAEGRDRLLEAMRSLNERYRLAVTLRYFHDLPIAEIAEVLRCSEGVTKNILFRSLRTMKKHLSAEGAR